MRLRIRSFYRMLMRGAPVLLFGLFLGYWSGEKFRLRLSDTCEVLPNVLEWRGIMKYMVYLKVKQGGGAGKYLFPGIS